MPKLTKKKRKELDPEIDAEQYSRQLEDAYVVLQGEYFVAQGEEKNRLTQLLIENCALDGDNKVEMGENSEAATSYKYALKLIDKNKLAEKDISFQEQEAALIFALAEINRSQRDFRLSMDGFKQALDLYKNLADAQDKQFNDKGRTAEIYRTYANETQRKINGILAAYSPLALVSEKLPEKEAFKGKPRQGRAPEPTMKNKGPISKRRKTVVKEQISNGTNTPEGTFTVVSYREAPPKNNERVSITPSQETSKLPAPMIIDLTANEEEGTFPRQAMPSTSAGVSPSGFFASNNNSTMSEIDDLKAQRNAARDRIIGRITTCLRSINSIERELGLPLQAHNVDVTKLFYGGLVMYENQLKLEYSRLQEIQSAKDLEQAIYIFEALEKLEAEQAMPVAGCSSPC